MNMNMNVSYIIISLQL